MYQRFSLLLLILLQSQFAGSQQRYEANWSSIDSRPVPAWFTDAKFGIFIHWGLYSVPAWAPTGKDIPVYSKYSEWYWRRLNDTSRVGKLFQAYHLNTYGKDFKYADFVRDFRAELFDPAQWAQVFKASGAKYVVLTSKHHEGFTLWPSEHSWNWNSVDVGPHRDLAGDLIDAVRKAGIRMGYYYSLYEWYNPLYKKDVNRYVDEHMMPQLKDLVTRYKPDIVWTDGEWDHPSETWKSTQFLSWLYNESPVRETVVVNDRWGKETRGKHGGYYTTEYDLIHDSNAKDSTIAHPWEECRGIGSSFGYNRAETLEDYATSAQLIHMLIEKVARGGNLLLDIGPTADGRIPVIMQQRLTDIGAWLAVNGEAIYGTNAWTQGPPIKTGTTVFHTRKGHDLYVLATQWPQGNITIPGVKASGVKLLGAKTTVKYSRSGNGIRITPPVLSPADNPSTHAWVFKIENAL